MDHAAAGELDCLVHVDAQVLDRLEGADRLAELAPYFGVFDDEVQDCPCRAERVSGPGDRHVIDQRLDGVGRRGTQTLRGRLVEP